MNSKLQTYLTPAELVARWNGAVTKGTLANWRSKKKGPAFQKFGANVRYPIAKLEAYEREHMNDNTEPSAKENAA